MTPPLATAMPLPGPLCAMRLSPWSLLLFTPIVVLAAPQAAHAQAPDADPGRFLRWSYQDAGALLRDANPHLPLFVFGGAALLLPASQLDPSLRDEVREANTGAMASYLNVTNELGGPHMMPVVAGVFAASLATGDARFQDAAFTSLQSLVYAGVITTALKETFGRVRPEDGQGAHHFDPFSGNASFPSGHTAAAFAILTPWVLHYPHPVTYGLFALSTGTALARIARDKHWPTDVAAGAAIGFLTARYLTHRHQQAPGRPGLDVMPIIGPGAAGLSLRLRLH